MSAPTRAPVFAAALRQGSQCITVRKKALGPSVCVHRTPEQQYRKQVFLNLVTE